MPDFRATPACAAGQSTRFKEAVCVEAERIFDSCSDKDCLEDLQVFFSSAGQSVINGSTLIKCRSAEVMDTYLLVEDIPFNKGYCTVECTFYFRLNFNCYTTPLSTPVNVRGLAVYTKKIVLYGGEGCVKTFYSNFTPPEEATPVACLKATDPLVLGSCVVESVPIYEDLPRQIPDCISAAFDGGIILQPGGNDKIVLVTIGIFTIITLQRSVQLMIPAYDYVLPEKEAAMSPIANDPCEMFKRIRFPTNEFFPDDVNEADCGNCN